MRATGADRERDLCTSSILHGLVLEAKDAGLRLVRLHNGGVPTLDMLKVKHTFNSPDSYLVGPNCPGVITPGQCKIGIMPGEIHLPGKVGVVSRSGTLTYEAVKQTTDKGFGQSTCVGIGGDPIPGMNFVDVLKLFQNDPDTEAIVMVGEIAEQAKKRRRTSSRAMSPNQLSPTSQELRLQKGNAWDMQAQSSLEAKEQPLRIAALERAGVKLCEI